MPSAPLVPAPVMLAENVALSPIGFTGVLFTTVPAEPVTPSVVSVADAAAPPVPAATAAVPLVFHVVSVRAGRVAGTPPVPPYPDKATVTVPLVVVTARDEDEFPDTVGAKVTGTVAEAAGAMVTPLAGSVAVKGAAGAVTAVTVSVMPPLFVSVRFCDAVEATLTLPNASDVGVAVRV
jgi:hypothetical protein